MVQSLEPFWICTLVTVPLESSVRITTNWWAEPLLAPLSNLAICLDKHEECHCWLYTQAFHSSPSLMCVASGIIAPRTLLAEASVCPTTPQVFIHTHSFLLSSKHASKVFSICEWVTLWQYTLVFGAYYAHLPFSHMAIDSLSWAQLRIESCLYTLYTSRTQPWLECRSFEP